MASSPTIRSKLTRVVLSCVAPAVLLAVAWAGYVYQKERERLARDNIGRARAIVSAVDVELAGIRAGLLTLAASGRLAGERWEEFYEQAQQAQRALNVNNIVVSDRRLAQRINTLRPFGNELPTDQVSWLRSMFETGRPVTTDLFTGALLKKPVVAVAVPVRRNGEVAYVVAAGMTPDRLADLLRRQRLPENWIGAIFDSTGTIVSRTHQMEKFVGLKGSPPLVQRMTQVTEDSFTSRTLEGIEVITVFSKSTLSGWTVALGIPAQELSLMSELWPVLAGALLVLALSAAVAWRISASVAQAVQGLAEPAARIGSGEDIGTLPALGLKEADDVAAALSRTASRLRNAEHRARHDALTGLPNRQAFHELANHQATLSKRSGEGFCVLFIDLDGFKKVNDAHGHEAGDRLLRLLAGRLRAALRESDLIARLGGDEFAVLLPGTGPEAARGVAAKLGDSASAPYRLAAGEVAVTASIGLAWYPEDGDTSEALLKRADREMYAVKLGARRRSANGSP